MDLILAARDLGHTFCEFFAMPGNFVLTQLGTMIPHLASVAGLESSKDPALLTYSVSLLVWSLAATVMLRFVGMLRNLGRITATAFRMVAFRFHLALQITELMLMKPLRLFRSWRQSSGAQTGRIEFNDLDIVVLKVANAQHPGIAVSAPELAERFEMRPSQVQRSLDRLATCRFLESIIGSTDGYDNYRLTPSGATFINAVE